MSVHYLRTGKPDRDALSLLDEAARAYTDNRDKWRFTFALLSTLATFMPLEDFEQAIRLTQQAFEPERDES